MNWKVLTAGLVVVVPLVSVLAIGFRYDPKRIESPLVGRSAPEFSLLPVEGGEPVKLSSFRGKPVVLNFWATWCEPCKAEHPMLVDAARQLEGEVQFVGVVYQDEPAKITAWLDRYGSGFPTLVDLGAQAAVAYGVYGVPETYVIDQQGSIRYKFVGPVDPRVLAEQLRPLLSGS